MKRRSFLGVAGPALTGTVAATLLSRKTVHAGPPPDGSEKALLELDRRWMKAVVQRDEATLRLLTADDFKRIQEPWPNFSMFKTQWLSITLHDSRIESFRLLRQNVRLSGDNTAVVSNEFRWRGALGEVPLNETVTAENTWEQKDGRWHVVSHYVSKTEKVGRKTEPVTPRKAIEVDPAVYAAYVGQYQFGPSRILTISHEGGRLVHQGSGGQRAELLPETPTRFFRTDSSVVTVFVKKGGRVTQVVHRHANGRESTGKRIA